MGAQGIFDFGEEVGAATLVKLVGNFLIISAARSMSEALGMARSHGVDPRAVVDMLTQTLFPAPIYQSYGKRIAEGTASFGQSKIPLKDVGLFRRTAREGGVPTHGSRGCCMKSWRKTIRDHRPGVGAAGQTG